MTHVQQNPYSSFSIPFGVLQHRLDHGLRESHGCDDFHSSIVCNDKSRQLLAEVESVAAGKWISSHLYLQSQVFLRCDEKV